MRLGKGKWEIYDNKDYCPSTYQYIKLGFMDHFCYLQAQVSPRIEHTTCNMIQLSSKGV